MIFDTDKQLKAANGMVPIFS